MQAIIGNYWPSGLASSRREGDMESHRERIREWIQDNVPAGLKELAPWWEWITRPAGRDTEWRHAECSWQFTEWEQRLRGAGLICPTWPRKYGGAGLSSPEALVFWEECCRAGVPQVGRGIGERFVGPAILAHGTAAQKACFLPRIISGADRYCQGFSEPDHGSDLGSVATSARIIGSELFISGQKNFVTEAGRANMVAILCRTGPRRREGRGLSYVLVGLAAGNGISYHPVRQLCGQAAFGELHFVGTSAPVFNVIGGLHGGWAPAMTSLAHGRRAMAGATYVGLAHEFWQLIQDARVAGRTHDPALRARLAWAYTQIELLRWRCLDQSRSPGESDAAVEALCRAQYRQRLGELAVELAGASSLIRPPGEGYRLSRWQEVFLYSRADPISTGTNEIQRDIIAERILGLPKEPPGDAPPVREGYARAWPGGPKGHRTARRKSAKVLPSSSAKTQRPRTDAPSSTAGSQYRSSTHILPQGRLPSGNQ
jgi:alkylation response protein AidB-like acyl-CoA dehydrogenase